VIIQALGTQGVITVYDRQINDISNFFLPKGYGRALAAIVSGGFVAITAARVMSRRRAGLRVGNPVALLGWPWESRTTTAAFLSPAC
jgi:hypothetical protein